MISKVILFDEEHDKAYLLGENDFKIEVKPQIEFDCIKEHLEPVQKISIPKDVVERAEEEEPDYYTKLRNELAKDLYVHKHVNMTSAIDSANAFVKKLKELK